MQQLLISLSSVVLFTLTLAEGSYAARTPSDVDDAIVSKGYIIGALHPTHSSISRSGVSSNEALPPEEKVLVDGKHRDWEKKKGLVKEGVREKETLQKRLELEVEEFVVEHEISEPSARAAAKALQPEQMTRQAIGCQECTRKDMEYCAGSQVMSDHCCCDKRYTEVFPYVPHTCYLGAIDCRPVAADCAEYARLRECCCDAHLTVKWKAHLASAGTKQELSRRLWILPWIAITLSTLVPFTCT